MGLPVPTTRARARMARAALMVTLAVWLLTLPLRIVFALGLRRTVALVCLLVLAVTAYGVAEDLGLIEPPARAAPAHPKPTRAKTG